MIKSKQDSTYSAVPCRVEIGAAMFRIVLCDDNPHFLGILHSEIKKVLDANKIDAVIQTFESAECIPEQVLSTSDVFFLDIDFSGREYTGIDIARMIRKFNQDSIIVFITNFVEYAPEGYEVQAFRYVLKSEIREKLEPYLMQTITKLKSEQGTFQINVAGESIALPLTEILYIESQGHAAVIHVSKPGNQTTKAYKFYASLTSLEQNLSTQGFLRVQKSYLVNMRRIKKYQCTEALLDNGEILRVSEKNYAELKKQYLLWKGRQ